MLQIGSKYDIIVTIYKNRYILPLWWAFERTSNVGGDYHYGSNRTDQKQRTA